MNVINVTEVSCKTGQVSRAGSKWFERAKDKIYAPIILGVQEIYDPDHTLQLGEVMPKEISVYMSV